MGKSRLQLQTLLESLVPDKENVYYQEPATTRMQYPCIIYKHDLEDKKHADNIAYQKTRRYMVTVIDRDPDSDIAEAVSDLPMSSFVRRFAADQLNHTIYNVYF